MENLPPTRLEKRFSDGFFFGHKMYFTRIIQTDEGWEFSNNFNIIKSKLNGNIACESVGKNRNAVLDNHRPKSQKETFHHQYIIKVSAEFSR